MAQCAQLQLLYEETRSKQNTPKKGLIWKNEKGIIFLLCPYSMIWHEKIVKFCSLSLYNFTAGALRIGLDE